MSRVGRTGLALLAALVMASCADEDEPVETLDPLLEGGTASGGVATSAAAGTDLAVASTASTAPFEAAGDGIVTIQVRLASSGVDETLSLDRATLAADDVDPISLFAACTALDDGDGFTVNVTDLRRLASDRSLVAAVLTVGGEVTEPGEYEVTLDLADATLVSTRYSGTLALAPDMSSGTFDVVDESGNAATGSFACSASSPATTKAAPPTTTPTVTRPPVTTGVTPTTPG